MLRLVLFLIAVAALASGLSWLADRPGLIQFAWEGYEGEISVFHAVVAAALLIGLTIFLWSLVRSIWIGPAVLGRFVYRRRQKRGLEALSSGIIAIGAGDKSNAMRYAIQARKTLPNEPLTHLLRAQAAQLSGDKATARRIFESMLAQPDTEQLGLRGLFLEAQREGETEAAKQFAERALGLNPQLAWSAEALFDLQCKAGDWAGALVSLASSKKHGHVEKQVADRRRAVLLTAKAQGLEDSDSEKALNLALEAHGLAPGLVPAAAIAARILASRGNTSKAAKVIQKTWLKSPHPDLAAAYAYARIGDSPRDRLERVRQLASLTSNSIESPIAVARAAIESRDFDAARFALEPLLEERLTQRVATLMARIEAEQHGDKGRVREWLARAVNAPRDPAWIADGVVAEHWAPVSPVTGQLDAFEWRVPVETMSAAEGELIAQQIEKYAALGSPRDAAASERTVDIAATAKDVTAKPVAAAEGATSSAAERPATASAPTATPAAQPATATNMSATEPRQQIDRAAAETITTAAPPSTTRTAPTVVPEADSVPTPTQVASAPMGSTKPQTAASTGTAVHPTMTDARPDTTGVPPSASPATLSGKAVAAEPSASDASTSRPASPRAVGGADATGATAAAVPNQTKFAPVSAPAKTNAVMPAKTDFKPHEPKIFVSPRAPDDPGPESDDGDDVVLPARPRYGSPH